MATVTVNYFGVSGTGRTVKEAKLDAGRKIEQSLSHRPRVYRHKALSLFVWADPAGGSYTITDGQDDKSGRHLCSASEGSFDDATQKGIRHLLSYNRPVGDYEIPSWADSYAQGLVAEWARSDRFQVAYKEAIAAGKTDTEAHYAACLVA